MIKLIKNWLLPNVDISNMLKNNGDDDREWICHEQDHLCKFIKVEHSIHR
jgi:hypothetical protein